MPLSIFIIYMWSEKKKNENRLGKKNEYPHFPPR